MAVYAFVFPGQGSQGVGMGRDLAAAFAPAREVFEEIDETLRQRLSKLMFEGPAEDLTLTENAQPALLAHSLAVARVLEREGGVRLADRAAVVAGHSLGEYSALAAAGSFALGGAARLLKLRGQAMQRAVSAGEGAMAALLGADLEQARAICDAAAETPEGEREVIEPANDNGGGQVVISGARGAVERALGLARERGVKRAMLLPVSAPFHCALMAPAADAMRDALGATPPGVPAVPLIANVSAQKVTEPAEIARLLIEQVTATVRWRESVETMAALGVDSFVELGAGKVLRPDPPDPPRRHHAGRRHARRDRAITQVALTNRSGSDVPP
jgi:[acyl-carrier-protein] S-malonyltransferase